jgi:hypothetical protein
MLEGPGGTKAPAATILPVQQCETLVAGMRDNDSKTLAGARRSGRFGFWHLLCGGTARGGLRQLGRSGSDPFATCGY